MERIVFENINPFVRYAQFLTISSNRQYVNLAPYDYRLFFCYDGSGKIQVDGVIYDMKIGSFLLWPPGLHYRLTKTVKVLPLCRLILILPETILTL